MNGESYYPFETFEQRDDEMRGPHRVTVGHPGISLRLKVALEVMKAMGPPAELYGRDGQVLMRHADLVLATADYMIAKDTEPEGDD